MARRRVDPLLRCSECGYSFRQPSDAEVRHRLAEQLGVPPSKIGGEDLALFGRDCLRCGKFSYPIKRERVTPFR